jgi:hypothetical protein
MQDIDEDKRREPAFIHWEFRKRYLMSNSEKNKIHVRRKTIVSKMSIAEKNESIYSAAFNVT